MNKLRFFITVSALGLITTFLFFTRNTESEFERAGSVPTLTFHILASNEQQAILGGSLEGPAAGLAHHAELVVQLFRDGKLWKHAPSS